VGAQARLGVQRGAFRADWGVLHAFAREVLYEVPADVGARLSLTSALARGCLVAPSWWKALEVVACVGMEAGRMRGEGVGVMRARTSRQPWLGVSLGPTLQIALSERWSALLEAEALIPLLDVRYHVRGLSQLYASERAVLRAGVGLAWTFFR
jgi:hypothetical protein